MVATAELAKYLHEIREQVCSRCIERPPGGPPCAPLGKTCGVEMHLPELIDSIHAVRSDWIEPYLDHNRQAICSKCAFLHSRICPCPMEYLLALITEAVETVDGRLQHSEQARRFVSVASPLENAAIEEVRRAYQQATGTWTGCDWPTRFGNVGLDLNGLTAAEAEEFAEQSIGTVIGKDWQAAARWLTVVEWHAKCAEQHAADAVAAASRGAWKEAFEHAYQAWILEFGTGRSVWRGFPMTWQPLRQTIETVLQLQGNTEGEDEL
jgi:hypothetical protein